MSKARWTYWPLVMAYLRKSCYQGCKKVLPFFSFLIWRVNCWVGFFISQFLIITKNIKVLAGYGFCLLVINCLGIS